LRLEVAVDDAERVRLGDGLTRLKDEVDRFLDGDRPSRLHDLGKVGALEKLHHHVGRAVVEHTHVDDLRDVFAPQADGRAGLALEA
jgi:hypothetical protein